VTVYYVQDAFLTWKDDWVRIALSDSLDIAMVFFIGVIFGPVPEPLLFRAFDGSYAAVRAE
jgi:hypothetical protein